MAPPTSREQLLAELTDLSTARSRADDVARAAAAELQRAAVAAVEAGVPATHVARAAGTSRERLYAWLRKARGS